MLLQNSEQRLFALSCLSVRLSVPVEHLGYHWTDFNETWYLSIFRKSVEKIQVSLKSDKNNVCCVRKTVYCTFTIVSRWIFPRTRNISDKRDREIQNIHFMFNNFFSKNRTFYEICDLIYYSQTGYRWQHNTAHTPCTLDIYGYRHTHTHTHTQNM